MPPPFDLVAFDATYDEYKTNTWHLQKQLLSYFPKYKSRTVFMLGYDVLGSKDFDWRYLASQVQKESHIKYWNKITALTDWIACKAKELGKTNISLTPRGERMKDMY